ESTKQCGRANSMEILPPVKFKEFLKMDSGKKFFGSMDVPESFKRDIFKDNNEKVICAVGPEGGFSEKEDEELKVNHFTPVSLGLYRLRAETAAITAAAILSSLLRK
ncbi:MAG: RNA methyltransferase, partial [Candidatus Aureabacteria bacterium]|nr:RNA methyltransferase [Candidatus Auribacterota bacterium]